MMRNCVCSGRKICKLSEEYLGEGWCSYCTPLSYNSDNKKFCIVINQGVKPIFIKEDKQLKLF